MTDAGQPDWAASLRSLWSRKKDFPTVGGQMVGLEQYRLQASGMDFEALLEAADELERRAHAIAALEKERDELKAGQFWERLFANREDFPDGMTAEAVKNELADYHFIMEQVPKVYDAVTGGLLSKTNYYAASVIAAFEEHVQRLVDDEINDRAALTASADKPETHNGTV